MRIIYYDGSVLECNTIYFGANEIIADDIYSIPILEVLRIESI